MTALSCRNRCPPNARTGTLWARTPTRATAPGAAGNATPAGSGRPASTGGTGPNGTVLTRYPCRGDPSAGCLTRTDHPTGVAG